MRSEKGKGVSEKGKRQKAKGKRQKVRQHSTDVLG